MSAGGEQLVSFFLYSLLIYPVTNYLVSPSRSYPRWKGALYAVGFLLIASSLHMMYENAENGPNHYQLMGVPRVSSLTSIKKAYRGLSLELHPDKNKAADAADEFRKVTKAFDTLSDKDKRREYNRLGDAGVATAAQHVIDHKHILIQLIVYYCSSAVFAFFMTFTEPTGDALSYTLFGMAVMLLIELLLVLQERELPGWFLPYYTPHDIVSTLRRFFPAYMNGCRVITGAFFVDRKAVRELLLSEISNQLKDITMRAASVARSLGFRVEHLIEAQEEAYDSAEEEEGEEEEGAITHEAVGTAAVTPTNETSNSAIDSGKGNRNSGKHKTPSKTPSKSPRNRYSNSSGSGSKRGSGSFGRGGGLMNSCLTVISKRVSSLRETRDGTLVATMRAKVAVLDNPASLRHSKGSDAAGAAGTKFSGWILLRDVTVYLLARYLLVKDGK